MLTQPGSLPSEPLYIDVSDDATLAVAGANGAIQLWDATTLNQLPHSPLERQTGFAYGVAFCGYGIPPPAQRPPRQ